MSEIQEFSPAEIVKDDRIWFDARSIHTYVKSGWKFSDWIKKRIEETFTVKGVDYLTQEKLIQVNGQGRHVTEYYVTPEMGQELGMLERNEQGHDIRQWFIARNKKLMTIETKQSKPLTPIQLLLLQAQVMADNEARTQAEFSSVRSEIASIKHEMYANTGYVSMKGYCHMKAIGAPLRLVNRYGSVATVLANRIGIVLGKVADERWGSVNSYPISFLEENWDHIVSQVKEVV